MATLAQLAQNAGLQIVESEINIPNFEFPAVLSVAGQESLAQSQSLFCNLGDAPPASLNLLYFTLPECENCRPGARSMDVLLRETQVDLLVSRNVICARVVISDWPTQPEVAIEQSSLGLKKVPSILWDAQGVLSERLAVVAHPAFFMLDRQGQVLAYQNGPVEFDSVGFRAFWNALMHEVGQEGFHARGEKLGAIFYVDRETLSSRPASFLGSSLLSVVWLVVFLLLCYHLSRFFLRLRKNFNGSEK